MDITKDYMLRCEVGQEESSCPLDAKMKSAWPLPLVAVLISFLFQQMAMAQADTVSKREFKNTVRFNITNPVIFGGRSIIFGYERVLKKQQTISVGIGSNGFPSLGIINSDSIKINSIRDEQGLHLSVDYRFYLGRENKYAAPRGVYIGPYYTYNYFAKKHDWLVQSSSGFKGSVESRLGLQMHTVGAELGYQFVFWNRLAIDMILLGPGVAFYNFKASIGSNLTDSDKEKMLAKINDALAEKFPGYSLIVNDTEFEKNGSYKTTSLGYRYVVHIGFRF